MGMWIIPTSSFPFVFYCWLHSYVMWCSLGLQLKNIRLQPQPRRRPDLQSQIRPNPAPVRLLKIKSGATLVVSDLQKHHFSGNGIVKQVHPKKYGKTTFRIMTLSVEPICSERHKINKRRPTSSYNLVQVIKNWNFDERWQYLGLIRLDKRRVRSDLIETFNIMNGLYDVNRYFWVTWRCQKRS